MATGLTYKIEDGTATTLSEIIDNLIRGFMWDFREGHALRPLEKVISDCDESIANREATVAAALTAIHDLEGKSDAELEAEALESWELHKAEFAQSKQRQDTERTRYDAALEKLRAWDPPEVLQHMKEGFIRHTLESREHSNYTGTGGPREKPTETGAAIREDQRDYLQRYHARQVKELNKARAFKITEVAIYTALHAELERVKGLG